MTIAIIGAGAAGCFAAIRAARLLPHAEICIYERMQRPLAKVAITGGGRCNLTNSFEEVRSTEAVYPRGARLMKRLFRVFDHHDAIRWFEAEGVPLVIQEDQCIFPQSQRAQDIVQTLLRLLRSHRVRLSLGQQLTSIRPAERGYELDFSGQLQPVTADAVAVCTGGSPRSGGLSFLQPLGVPTVAPVPSLFSFTLDQHPLAALSGIVVPDVTLRLTGTKFRAPGTLLITHWGISGPAVLRLSSYAARHLNALEYRAELSVNWLGSLTEEETVAELQRLAELYPQRQLGSAWPAGLHRRLWHHLLQYAGKQPEQKWAALGAKELRRLATRLTNHLLTINGRNPHKEEFVTCGGVDLSAIHLSTLECRTHKGLYFAGEVLDVDAVTGGFNLQAAWTMGYVVAESLYAQSREA